MRATVRTIAAMAYSEGLADDIRARIGAHPGVKEQAMFGGLAFMIQGNMAVTVSGNELMVRVGKKAHDEAASRPGASMVEMGKRSMRGWIKVSSAGIATEADFDRWVDQGVAYAASLPPK